jgi:hypothetical protein
VCVGCLVGSLATCVLLVVLVVERLCVRPPSSVVIGIEEDRVEDISFHDNISGPPRGRRSAVRRVAMLRAITEGQRGRPPRWEWKASSNGHC